MNVSSPNELKDLSIARRVAQLAASAPKSLAVQAGAETLTYGELELRSNRLACYLQSLDAGPDALVGIFLERSIDSVVSQLAVLKAGNAYLPLNPAAPADRVAFMLRDAGVSSVITCQGLTKKLPAGSWKVVAVDSDRGRISAHAVAVPSAASQLGDLAYVIYTSGSTGQPKGVEITRGGLENLIQWHLKAFHITPADRASMLASIGFDATIWELWPYLAAGASVHIPGEALRTQVEPLRDWLLQQAITISFVATPLAEMLMLLTWPAQTALRTLLTGADTLHRRPPQGLPFSLVNNYGPTECTVVATSGVVAPFGIEPKQPSIGAAIDNTQIHILDEQMHAVAQGTIGELYIGGAGLARGYRNRPDLTAERFVKNPFGDFASNRLYRTGDRARFLRSGEIEFLGRLDDQIKVRGYRIELDEISSVLDSHPDVKASVVAAAGEGEDKRLIAYLVLWPESKANAGAFRDFLQRQLPDYMIPAIFVRLDALPLTNNGKVDRAALPKPNGNTLPDETYIAPRSLVEQRLAELIAPLLRVERVGVNDNFFLLGGHSLLGTQLLTRISESFGVELSLLTVFDHPTLAGMSAEIEKLILAKIDSAPVAEPALPTGD
ncbi:MAG: non-ribosomal peptide synthetase [Candidatus Sulfotelmatobacter sp.]